MQSQQMQYLCAKFATSRHAQKSVTMSYEFNSNEVKALREQRAAAHAKAITVLAKGNTLTADDKLIYSKWIPSARKSKLSKPQRAVNSPAIILAKLRFGPPRKTTCGTRRSCALSVAVRTGWKRKTGC
jgi:hypothetical protein